MLIRILSVVVALLVGGVALAGDPPAAGKPAGNPAGLGRRGGPHIVKPRPLTPAESARFAARFFEMLEDPERPLEAKKKAIALLEKLKFDWRAGDVERLFAYFLKDGSGEWRVLLPLAGRLCDKKVFKQWKKGCLALFRKHVGNAADAALILAMFLGDDTIAEVAPEIDKNPAIQLESAKLDERYSALCTVLCYIDYKMRRLKKPSDFRAFMEREWRLFLDSDDTVVLKAFLGMLTDGSDYEFYFYVPRWVVDKLVAIGRRHKELSGLVAKTLARYGLPDSFDKLEKWAKAHPGADAWRDYLFDYGIAQPIDDSRGEVEVEAVFIEMCDSGYPGYCDYWRKRKQDLENIIFTKNVDENKFSNASSLLDYLEQKEDPTSFPEMYEALIEKFDKLSSECQSDVIIGLDVLPWGKQPRPKRWKRYRDFAWSVVVSPRYSLDTRLCVAGLFIDNKLLSKQEKKKLAEILLGFLEDAKEKNQAMVTPRLARLLGKDCGSDLNAWKKAVEAMPGK